MVRCTLLLCPLILSISSVLWMAYKRHLARVAVAPESRYFQRIYAVVSANFADPVSPEKAIYHGAIPGMLRTLDPHSMFFDQEEFRRHAQAVKGKHSGVGVELVYRDHQFVVVGCHSHSAALRAGIHPGDLVTAIDGKPTAAFSVGEVIDLLSRPEGTDTRISIVRDGRRVDFNLKTEVMARKSIPGITWIRPRIAYLPILVFDEVTPAELSEDLEKCRQQGMQGLILDLRDNPGGVVYAAVAVADQFLRAGETILHQRGRAFAAATYVATHGNGGYEYPMVILVNRNTASAAEAVAGALQDHDRAWVLGDDTYGKGLVQTVTSLPANTGLALVKSKYYTPSGRLLQRPHYNSLGYYERQPAAHRVTWMTDSGRPVYAGAGIGPDEHFAPESDRFQSSLAGRFVFLQFAGHYLDIHPTAANGRWQADEATLRDFHGYLKQHNFTFSNAEFARHDDWIRQHLRQAVLRTAFGLDETFELLVTTDATVERALNALPKAQALLESARRNPQHARLADARWCGNPSCR